MTEEYRIKRYKDLILSYRQEFKRWEQTGHPKNCKGLCSQLMRIGRLNVSSLEPWPEIVKHKEKITTLPEILGHHPLTWYYWWPRAMPLGALNRIKFLERIVNEYQTRKEMELLNNLLCLCQILLYPSKESPRPQKLKVWLCITMIDVQKRNLVSQPIH